MKLDNRPKKLLVKDVGIDGVQAVRDWYEAGGQVDVVETLESGDVVVTFRTRASAEQVRCTRRWAYTKPTLIRAAGSRQRVKYPAFWSKANQLVSWPADSDVGCRCDYGAAEDHT